MTDLTYPVAFGAGVLSFFSPCVLPMVPVYLANMAGITAVGTPSGTSGSRHVLLHTLSFVVGFSLVFIVMGIAAGFLGGVIAAASGLLSKIAGAVVFLFGLMLVAMFWIPSLNFEKRLGSRLGTSPGYGRSLLIGSVFSLGWTPCIGPILGAILTVAWSSQTTWYGASLLACYSLGLGLPFIVAGLAIGVASPLWKRFTAYSGVISLGSGGLLMILGVLLFTGRFTWISQQLMNLGQ